MSFHFFKALIQKKIIQRSCKGPISIKRVDASGDYIVIENTCIRKPIVLTNWTLRRRGVDVPINSFKFEKHFVLHPNKSVKIYAYGKGSNNPPYELMSETVKSWSNGTYAYTQLVDHLNQVLLKNLAVLIFASYLILLKQQQNKTQ